MIKPCPGQAERTSHASLERDTYFHMGPQGPLMRREGRSLRPPIFLKPFPVWVDNGRDRLIRAQSRLGWLGGDSDISERISGELKGARQIPDRG